MRKELVFTSDPADLTQAHAGGGCCLPREFAWPKTKGGERLLHLLTIPTQWVVEGTAGWISVFIPYSREDSYLHWEALTADGDNESVLLIHDNSGDGRNEYATTISPARRVHFRVVEGVDSNKNFCSKVYGVPAWLQDKEDIAGYRCMFALNGSDIDIAFKEEPGIFSDGVVYGFLKDGFESAPRPSNQGKVTFQFT
jgi:hypothetical protein